MTSLRLFDLGLPYSLQVQSNKTELIPAFPISFPMESHLMLRFQVARKSLKTLRKTIQTGKFEFPLIGDPPEN